MEEVNAYIRWAGDETEQLELAEVGCMKQFEQTGEWQWLTAAVHLKHNADETRKIANDLYGWYLV